MSKFTEAFESFLKQYFLEMKVISDDLNLYQAHVDDLYEQVENRLDDTGKSMLASLEESYEAEKAESNKLFFLEGFKRCMELNSYLNQLK